MCGHARARPPSRGSTCGLKYCVGDGEVVMGVMLGWLEDGSAGSERASDLLAWAERLSGVVRARLCCAWCVASARPR
eukprot:scaffold1867_cov247-Pinguiococcus_pyrenoidosus.AAC.20